MKISLQWIQDFVDIKDLDVHDLANDFTMRVAEVEQVQELNQHLSQIQVVQISKIEKHPHADKLNLVSFTNGKNEKTVVCGAPNVKLDMKVAYAPIGVCLPNGLVLTPKKIREVLSEGMLCSGEELGVEPTPEGLLALPADAPLGQSLSEYWQRPSEVILEVDNKSLTHRPDLWGLYGQAREVAAITAKKLKNPYDAQWRKKIEGLFGHSAPTVQIHLHEKSSAISFWGVEVQNVQIAPSPLWMQQRLQACGLRPINNMVDISNYVMLELGIPLHIYDRDQIKGDVFVELVGQERKFITLDEQERQLIARDTIIRDEQKDLVLAGVMGGLSSGVSEKTKNLFIEVANWKSSAVRMTSTRLGLRTDSSTRYEKGLDSHLSYQTLLRTVQLVCELCPKAKLISQPIYQGINLKEPQLTCLDLNLKELNNFLGTQLSLEKVVALLESLDFSVEVQHQEMKVQIPTFRSQKDITMTADLYEEIGRLIGYDHITPKAPRFEVKPVSLDSFKNFERKTQDYLSVKVPSLEVMTYPLVGEKILARAQWNDQAEQLKLVNALSVDADRMRPSLIPSLLDVVALNWKSFSDFSFFELGRVFHSDQQQFAKESRHLAIALCSKNKNQFLPFLNHVESYLQALQLPAQLKEVGSHQNPLIFDGWSGLHPLEQMNIQVMGRNHGLVFTVHPMLLRNYKVKGFVHIALLDYSFIEKIQLKNKAVKFKPFSRYPSSSFDCSVVVKGAPAARVLRPLSKIKNPLFKGAKIVSVFALDEQETSVTLRSHFESSDGTLQADEISSLEQLVVSTLNDAGFPLKN